MYSIKDVINTKYGENLSSLDEKSIMMAFYECVSLLKDNSKKILSSLTTQLKVECNNAYGFLASDFIYNGNEVTYINDVNGSICENVYLVNHLINEHYTELSEVDDMEYRKAKDSKSIFSRAILSDYFKNINGMLFVPVNGEYRLEYIGDIDSGKYRYNNSSGMLEKKDKNNTYVAIPKRLNLILASIYIKNVYLANFNKLIDEVKTYFESLQLSADTFVDSIESDYASAVTEYNTLVGKYSAIITAIETARGKFESYVEGDYTTSLMTKVNALIEKDIDYILERFDLSVVKVEDIESLKTKVSDNLVKDITDAITKFDAELLKEYASLFTKLEGVIDTTFTNELKEINDQLTKDFSAISDEIEILASNTFDTEMTTFEGKLNTDFSAKIATLHDSITETFTAELAKINT